MAQLSVGGDPGVKVVGVMSEGSLSGVAYQP
jgi:hypothetical protein